MNNFVLYSSFSLTLTVRGVSNKHCLLTFVILSRVGKLVCKQNRRIWSHAEPGCVLVNKNTLRHGVQALTTLRPPTINGGLSSIQDLFGTGGLECTVGLVCRCISANVTELNCTYAPIPL